MIKITKKINFTFIQIILLFAPEQLIAKMQSKTQVLQRTVIIAQMLYKKRNQDIEKIVEITKLLKIQEPIFKKAQKLLQEQQLETKAKKLLSKKIKSKKRNKIYIQNINIQKNDFNENGNPTSEILKKLLIQEYFPRFHKNLTVEVFNAGNTNEALYRVFDKKNREKSIFFLKIDRSYNNITHEVENLDNLQRSAIGRLGLDKFYYPNTKKIIPQHNLPRLIWIDRFWTYENEYHQKKFIAVTHAAHGSTISNILHGTDKNLQNKTVEVLGTALASFQQAFMKITDPNDASSWKTVAHTDLHAGNVLFDPKTERIYLIDNGKMQPDYSLFTDLNFLLYYDMPDQKLRDIFLTAYINAYPENQRMLIIEYLKKKLGAK